LAREVVAIYLALHCAPVVAVAESLALLAGDPCGIALHAYADYAEAVGVLVILLDIGAFTFWALHGVASVVVGFRDGPCLAGPIKQTSRTQDQRQS
jgi:hypothetical protein